MLEWIFVRDCVKVLGADDGLEHGGVIDGLYGGVEDGVEDGKGGWW